MSTRFLLLGVAAGCLLWALPASAEEPKAADINQVRLYVPIPDLENRLGKDVEPIANYMKAVAKRADEILAKEKKPGAKGLLVAVGIKSKSKARVWCQAIDGEIPAELLEKLEKELGKIEAIDLRKAPFAFALEMGLHGQKPKQFPEFPDLWLEAAKKSKTMLLSPPDELFKSIWPDDPKAKDR